MMMRSKKIKLLSLAILSIGLSQNVLAEDHWKLFLKNAYIDRDFDNDAVKDTGSWSQAISLFYDSKFQDTPIDQLQIGLRVDRLQQAIEAFCVIGKDQRIDRHLPQRAAQGAASAVGSS